MFSISMVSHRLFSIPWFHTVLCSVLHIHGFTPSVLHHHGFTPSVPHLCGFTPSVLHLYGFTPSGILFSVTDTWTWTDEICTPPGEASHPPLPPHPTPIPTHPHFMLHYFPPARRFSFSHRKLDRLCFSPFLFPPLSSSSSAASSSCLLLVAVFETSFQRLMPFCWGWISRLLCERRALEI